MSDLAKWRVVGAVRTLKTEWADWDAGANAWKAPRLRYSAQFRADGRLSDVETVNWDGSIARTVYLYDAADRLIEAQYSLEGGKYPTRMRTRYLYDAAGRSTRTVTVLEDGTEREAETYSYDRDGRKTKVQFGVARVGITTPYPQDDWQYGYQDPEGTTYTTTYDDRDRPIEQVFHDAGHNVLRRVQLTRDKDGRLLRTEVRFAGAAPFNIDENAQLAKASADERAQLNALMASAFPDKTLHATTYAYDQHGRLLERTRAMGIMSAERTTFRYDEHGNEIEELTDDRGQGINMDERGMVHAQEQHTHQRTGRHDYRYDGRGNWIEKTSWMRARPQEEFQRVNIERRDITYYGG